MTSKSLINRLKSSPGFKDTQSSEIGFMHAEACKKIPLSDLIKINSKWMKNQHLQPDTIHLLEETLGKLQGMGTG